MKAVFFLFFSLLAMNIFAAETVYYSSDFKKDGNKGWVAQAQSWQNAGFSGSTPGCSSAIYVKGSEKQVYLIAPHLDFKVRSTTNTFIELEVYIDSPTPPEYLAFSLKQAKISFAKIYLYPAVKQWITWKIPFSELKNPEKQKYDVNAPVTWIQLFSMKNKAADPEESTHMYIRSVKIYRSAGYVNEMQKKISDIINEWKEFKEIKKDESFSQPLVADNKKLDGNFQLGADSIIFSSSKYITQAKVLKDNLSKILKTDLKETNLEESEIPLIVISNRKLKLQERIDIAKFNDDTYLLDINAERIIIAGKTERGLLNGVYSFLDGLGMRWFMPGDIGCCISELGLPIYVKSLRELASPFFDTRYIWYAWGLWCKGYNTESDMKRFDEWCDANKLRKEIDYMSHHSFFRMFPEKEYFKEHPEYFALIDNKRIPCTEGEGQICTSNKDVQKITADYIKEIFRVQPNLKGASLSTNDNPRSCECEECRKYYIGNRRVNGKTYAYGCWEGADLQMAFMNRIRNMIKDDYPDKYLCTNIIYDNIERAPVKVKPDPHLVFSMTTMASCKFHPLNNPDCPLNREIYDIFKEWAAFGNPISYRDYDPIVYWKGLPAYNYRRILKDLKMLAKECRRPLGFNTEAHRSWASTIPNYYIKAKFAWHPHADMEKVLDDFYLKFFGLAALDMKNYMEFFQYLLEKSPCHPVATDLDSVVINLFSEKAIKVMSSYINKAVGKVPRNSVYYKRVQMISMELDYLKLFLNMLKEMDAKTPEKALMIIDQMIKKVKEMHSLNPDFITEKYVLEEIEKHKKNFEERASLKKRKKYN
ncbi:MAG: hypothetical protein A2017_09640 [Lentisphaerae bacterium GWF2_44_16]|nr:MAG: hypothetical protein A2017_09640 [Lentisphaerae bacterium GWF2_44_16]